MALERLEAPFSAEAVQILNEYQTSIGSASTLHPFTCANRGDGQHGKEGGDLGVLIATEHGWVCPSCDYTQQWAHSFMADASRPSSPNPFDLRTDEDKGLALIDLARELQHAYLVLKDEKPEAPGVDVMIGCLSYRYEQLLHAANASGLTSNQGQEG